jgi:undecaprenyl-diphosphatase
LSVLHAIILGIVQGLSEFLPISSSGHLILVPQLLGWNDLAADNSLNKSFDVALHLGTLVAAIWYFRRDLWGYVRAAWDSVRARAVTTVDQRVGWLLLLSAIPGALVGALFESTIEDTLGDPILIGVNLIVFGLVLEWADRTVGTRRSDDYRKKDAAVMGVAQALALAPGVSRSGITISAGRWLRFSREGAARLSFLMAIPITGGAVLYKGAELFGGKGIPPGFGGAFLWGTIAAAISGFFAIAVLLRYVRTHSFLPFVVYRVVLGAIVIVLFATGLR